MGMVEVVADILKFPWPLFPKYRKHCTKGNRFVINTQGDNEFVIDLSVNSPHEIQSAVFSCRENDDGDCYSLYLNDSVLFSNIYTKGRRRYGLHLQHINIRPVVKVESSDTIKLVFRNNSGITSKTIWFDLIMTAN
jgi:hypothetical protein